jgi:hypothetical protein
MTMKNTHAVALGKLGGKARIAQMGPDELRAWARLGGLARAARHPKEQLSRWAKMGGRPPKRARINGTVCVSPASEQPELGEQPSHFVPPEADADESSNDGEPTSNGGLGWGFP